MGDVVCTKDFTIHIEAAEPPPPPTEGLAAYYKCDEASGTSPLEDEIGAYDLTSGGAALMVSVPGKIGTAINQSYGAGVVYGHAADAYLNLNSDFTIRFWFKLDIQITYGVIFSSTGFNSWRFYLVDDGSSDYFEWYAETDGSSKTLDSVNLTLGDWTRVIAWYESGVGFGLKLNNDAPVLAADLGARTGNTTADLALSLSTKYEWDEIAIWARKLSDAEMLYDWNSGAGRTYPDVP